MTDKKFTELACELLLLENPDTLSIYDNEGFKTTSVRYRDSNNVCTGGVVYSEKDDNNDFLNHIVGCSLVNNQPFCVENDQTLKNHYLTKLPLFMDDLKRGSGGHSYLDV